MKELFKMYNYILHTKKEEDKCFHNCFHISYVYQTEYGYIGLTSTDVLTCGTKKDIFRMLAIDLAYISKYHWKIESVEMYQVHGLVEKIFIGE